MIMLKKPFNILWKEGPENPKDGVSVCIQVNVSSQVYWNPEKVK